MIESKLFQVLKGPFKGMIGEGVTHPDPDYLLISFPNFKNPETIEKIYRSYAGSIGNASTKYDKKKFFGDRSKGVEHNCFCRGACKCRIFSRRDVDGEKTDYLLIDENVIQIKVRSQQDPKQGPVVSESTTRGKITYFSKGSRKRMIIRMAQMARYPNIWQDLTFADDVMQNKSITERAEFSAKCMKRLKRWIKRTYGQKFWGVWRREWEDRKSGKLYGEVIPHFHCLFSYPVDQKKYIGICLEIAKKWVEITDTKNPAAIKVAQSKKSFRWLNGKKMAQVYVSKYVAKEQYREEDQESFGRFWGEIGNGPRSKQEVECLTESEITIIRRFLRRYVSTKRMKRLIANRETGSWLLINRNTMTRLIKYVKSLVEERALQKKELLIPF